MNAAPHLSITEFIVDGHVHVHPAYDERSFLTAARENLSRHGDGMPTLLLAEMAGANVFARWRSGNAPWEVTLTDEPHSLLLGKPSAPNLQPSTLLVIAGRQIATAERLEVMALFSDDRFEDGQSLDRTLDAVTGAGALPLLPWGVGKWSGRRGQLVARAAKRPGVLLGDNAGRPLGWPEPSIFHRHVVLPGTDPLRLRSEESVVGTYGFKLHGEFDMRTPARDIRSALEKLTRSPERFGRRVGPAGFLRQQAALRLTK